jgi:uncharacterized protein (DUF433 family)
MVPHEGSHEWISVTADSHWSQSPRLPVERWYPDLRRIRDVNALELTGIVHSDPEVLSGTPVFVGTRVPVASLFDHLKAGDSIEVFLDGFPSVKREQVIAILDQVEHQVAARRVR